MLEKKSQIKVKRRGRAGQLSDSSVQAAPLTQPWHNSHSSLWGPILCIVGYLEVHLDSIHQTPVAHTTPLSYDHQDCLQTLLNIPWGVKMVPVGNHLCTLSYLILQMRNCGPACKDEIKCSRTHKKRWSQNSNRVYQRPVLHSSPELHSLPHTPSTTKQALSTLGPGFSFTLGFDTPQSRSE